MHELTLKICRMMDFTGEIVYNQQMEGQIRKPSDNSKLREMLPNFEFTSIEDGLQETINWFVENYEGCRK